MTSDALIHLRVPAATKARWVRQSRAKEKAASKARRAAAKHRKGK